MPKASAQLASFGSTIKIMIVRIASSKNSRGTILFEELRSEVFLTVGEFILFD